MKKIRAICFLLFVGIISLLTTSTYAEEHGVGYEIRPILPSSQIDPSLGYYYLQTEPGEKQTFSLSILNTSDKEKVVEVFVEDAFSSDLGTIVYELNKEKQHESLVNPISEIVTLKSNEVVLKPKDETIVDFDVTPPNDHYEGVKIGRLVVREKDEEGKSGVKQTYQYALGIITSESGVAYNDGKALDLELAQANVSFGKKVIEANIVNPEPKTIEDLRVRSYVTKKGDSKKIKERNIDNFAFAPNSRLTYSIPWGMGDFVTGEYTFHFKAENQFESFDMSTDFTIRADDAKRLNSETAFAVSTPYFLIYIICGMNAILIVLFVIIIKRDKGWIKEIKEKKKKKNKSKSKRDRSK